MDPGAPIGGLASIRVLVGVDGLALNLNLDPVYDRHHDVGRESIPAGTLATYCCPVCRRSLLDPVRLCQVCGAPTLVLLNGPDDPVYQCSRQGCHATVWPSRDQAGPKLMVELQVEDTGSGIPPENLPHIFEPFFSSKGNRGTGLGLAVTWGIIEGHDGTIDVRSEVGRGTCFTVRLPLAPSGRSTRTAS
jgi:hypothetical protein